MGEIKESKCSMEQFQPGTSIKNNYTELSYVVSVNYRNRATAVRTVDITNPSECTVYNGRMER